jgi:hypothetical protein
VHIVIIAGLMLIQPQQDGEIVKGAKTSFSLPIKDWVKPRQDGKKEHLLRGVSFVAGFSQPLRRQLSSGSQAPRNLELPTESTPVATLSVKYNPISYWFAQTTLYAYTKPGQQAPWNPDFTYTVGYDDWHPYTFSLVYANYGGNRLRPDRSRREHVSLVSEGTISLGWKFKLPRAIENQLKVTDSNSMGWSVNYNVTPRFTDAKTLKREGPKHALTLSHRNQVYKNFYWNVTAYYYPSPEQQQPWNPDFTYGFGYADYKPGGISIQYNNYSGNRFPGRPHAPGIGTFHSGSISMSWNWAWAQ